MIPLPSRGESAEGASDSRSSLARLEEGCLFSILAAQILLELGVLAIKSSLHYKRKKEQAVAGVHFIVPTTRVYTSIALANGFMDKLGVIVVREVFMP